VLRPIKSLPYLSVKQRLDFKGGFIRIVRFGTAHGSLFQIPNGCKEHIGDVKETVKIRKATENDASAIEQLYAEMGYRGGWSLHDEMLLVEIGDQPLGVVRLVNESGITVLRGMYVRYENQHQGIGTELLNAVADLIEKKEAYCIPFSHLAKFYGQIGFREINDQHAPEFLVERKEKYLEAGHQATLMKKFV
jgi:N-acetylglutamate synthase-like GNAT family acetyltransferase